jgi:hypothetical protein
MKDVRKRVIDHIKENLKELSAKEATVGIDAFIDKIQNEVESKSPKNEYFYFNDIAKFGSHIVSKGGKSCGVEVCQKFTKLGGCAPTMSNALGALSLKVNCVAALGYPEIDPLFKTLSPNCTLYTIGNPGYTTALEFDDGKVMLVQKDYLHKIDWEVMKNMIGLDKLKHFFFNSNLIGLVDWNNMTHCNNIFKGILEEVLPEHTLNKSQLMFFDLADFSEKSREDILKVVELMNKFNKHYKVILSLNEVEAALLYRALYPEICQMDLKAMGQVIFEALEIDGIVVHTLNTSIAWDKNGAAEVPSLYVKRPKLSTGAGDNFNAGLCLGQLIGLNFEESLYIANATTGYYVRNAHSPNIQEVLYTLDNWENLIELQ